MKPSVVVVSDYAHFAGGICIFIENVIRNSLEEVSYSLVTWRNELTESAAYGPLAALFEEVVLIDAGNVVSAVDVMSNADLIFLQTSCNVRLLSVMTDAFCQQTGKPLVSVLHTTSHSSPLATSKAIQNVWYRSILLRSSFVVCVSQAVKDSIQDIIDGESVRVAVIDNASRFTFQDKKVKKAKKSKVVSFVGRPVNAKGINDFVEIAKTLIDTDITFVCNSVDKDPRPFRLYAVSSGT